MGKAKTVLLLLWSNKAGCRDRVAGVNRYARTRGWRVQIVERGGLGGRIPVRELVAFWHPVGIIAECGGGMPEFTREAAVGIPVVRFDEDPRRSRSAAVVSDSNSIGGRAARELLELGLEHFAFVGYSRSVFWSRDRCDAFRKALKLNGFSCSVFPGAAKKGDGGEREAALAAWLSALPKPCGVFAAHDPVGAGVLAAAKAAGLSVPGDVAVVSVDDIPALCEASEPTLTSIRPDFERGGYLAAEMLGRLIDGFPPEPRVLTYPPIHVSRRETTIRPRRRAKSVGKAVAFVRRAATGRLSVAQVAAEMGCSPRQAQKRFAEAVGHSVLTEITAVRIEQAKSLLRNPRLTMDGVAMRCGWSSVSSLRAAFHAATGMSPRQWRRTMA